MMKLVEKIEAIRTEEGRVKITRKRKKTKSTLLHGLNGS